MSSHRSKLLPEVRQFGPGTELQSTFRGPLTLARDNVSYFPRTNKQHMQYNIR